MDAAVSILLVEDNIDDVEVLRRFIRRLPGSYRVEIAYTAAEGIEKAQARRYDVMLVDQRLPDVSGRELIRTMREAVPQLPVVMLTGHGDERLAVEVMKAGAYDYLRKDDLDRDTLARTLHNVLERARLEAAVRAANDRLREWAIRDGLTGLYNHRHFQELLRNELARAERYDQPLACVMVDLDHFKQINDTYGHPFGDEVLKKVAAALTDGARKVDLVARYGGEEFVLVLPSTDAHGAVQVAERVRRAVEAEPFRHDGRTVHLTLSLGVATSELPGVTDEHSLVKRADMALYAAKRAGRNRVMVAGPADDLRELQPTPAPPAARDDAAGEVRRRLLATLTELDDHATPEPHRGHSRRVAELALRLGRALDLDTETLQCLEAGALLHDVGRVTVDDAVWLKPGPLDPEEREQVQLHTVLGARVVSRSGVLVREAEIVRSHHERWDGDGYPDGLAGEAIPLLARIVAIADGFEALTASRTWRDALPVPEALRVLEQAAGTVYDPRLVRVFTDLVGEVH